MNVQNSNTWPTGVLPTQPITQPVSAPGFANVQNVSQNNFETYHQTNAELPRNLDSKKASSYHIGFTSVLLLSILLGDKIQFKKMMANLSEFSPETQLTVLGDIMNFIDEAEKNIYTQDDYPLFEEVKEQFIICKENNPNISISPSPSPSPNLSQKNKIQIKEILKEIEETNSLKALGRTALSFTVLSCGAYIAKNVLTNILGTFGTVVVAGIGLKVIYDSTILANGNGSYSMDWNKLGITIPPQLSVLAQDAYKDAERSCKFVSSKAQDFRNTYLPK